MADYRIPRAMARRQVQYLELMNGQRPTIKGLVAAPFLPIAEVEPHQDDPIVIPAGTWVGILSTGASNSVYTIPYSGTFAAMTGAYQYRGVANAQHLAPACAQRYRVRYSTKDTDTTFYTPGGLNIDTNAIITTGGDSAQYVGFADVGVKPVGIVYNDIYASWLGTQYLNYDRQPNIGFLSEGMLVQVPVMTTQERSIEPGDKVVVDGFGVAAATNLMWDPSYDTVSAINMRVGHLQSLEDATLNSTSINSTGAIKIMDYVVGRCVRKIKLASGSSSGVVLSTYVNSATTANVSPEFRHAGRVQTVPGLGLQGSGTKGLPGHLLKARGDANGDFWALEIQVGCY